MVFQGDVSETYIFRFCSMHPSGLSCEDPERPEDRMETGEREIMSRSAVKAKKRRM